MKYAYRLETKRVRERDFPYPEKELNCTHAVLEFSRSLQDSDIEKFLVLHLDAQHHLNCIQIIAGTVNQAVVYPREVIRHSLLSSSCGMIFIHNHPSGHIKPSDADIRLTRTLSDTAKLLDIQVLDHIILGSENKFFSFREEGIMPGC
jgi:DNA repair protein RadC